MIGMVLAAHYPDVVDHLVLSSFMCRYDCAARLMRRTWIEAAESSGMKAVADLTAVAGFSRNFLNSARADFQLEQLRDAFSESEPGTFVAAARALLEVDLSPLADTIRAHVLLIGGAEDTMTPSDPGDSGYGMKQLEGELRNGRLVVLNSCGHYVVIEQPAETAQQIIDFICG
jgi:pimeloyl-ACP methyl ester carboxylesterase